MSTHLKNRPVSEDPPAWFNLRALGTTGGAGILKTTGIAVAVRGYDMAGVNACERQ